MCNGEVLTPQPVSGLETRGPGIMACPATFPRILQALEKVPAPGLGSQCLPSQHLPRTHFLSGLPEAESCFPTWTTHQHGNKPFPAHTGLQGN